MKPAAHAQETGKTVRVGWYESPFNTADQFGRRSGYAYDYQQKIAAYTGWEYDYVEGSWAELTQKLKTGEIVRPVDQPQLKTIERPGRVDEPQLKPRA